MLKLIALPFVIGFKCIEMMFKILVVLMWGVTGVIAAIGVIVSKIMLERKYTYED